MYLRVCSRRNHCNHVHQISLQKTRASASILNSACLALRRKPFAECFLRAGGIQGLAVFFARPFAQFRHKAEVRVGGLKMLYRRAQMVEQPAQGAFHRRMRQFKATCAGIEQQGQPQAAGG